MRFHCQTAGVTLTAQQPHNNVVRVAYQALAAVLGGTQSLHTNALDETLALPTEESVRIALRTQQILAYETGVPNVADPLGGSYYVEALTDGLEREAEGLFAEIEAQGGVVRGHRDRLVPAADRLQLRRGSRPRWSRAGGPSSASTTSWRRRRRRSRSSRWATTAEQTQRERLARVRAARDPALVAARLAELRRAAAEDRNIIPAMLDCARAYCTLYEIRHVLEEIYGSYREPVFF